MTTEKHTLTTGWLSRSFKQARDFKASNVKLMNALRRSLEPWSKTN